MSTRKVLFIGTVWPEPRSSGAGVRTRALVDQLLARSWAVHFAAASGETGFTEELRRLGVKTHPITANDSALDPWIRDLAPDVVILDRFVMEEHYGWRIREHSPHSAIVLDTVDLHCLRRAREASAAGIPSDRLLPVEGPDLATDDTYREISTILRSDLSLMISRDETGLLLSMGVPSQKLLTIPYSYLEETMALPRPRYEERAHFVSLGNFRHPPNLDSVRLLARRIWPQIREVLPDAELHLYGAYPPKEVSELRVPGLRAMGPCEDAIETLSRYRVLLAPLRYGAGLKGKIADAWIAGTPVCTTTIGAEGYYGAGDSRGFAGECTDQISDFVESAVRLYRTPDRWEAFSAQGQKVARKFFDDRVNGDGFSEALLALVETLPSRRKADYLQGAFLQQQVAASKYLSKWIEAKNRVKE